MIKKIFTFVFLALLLSCNPKNNDDQFKIISTIYPYYIMAQELFGKHFSIDYLPAKMKDNQLVFNLSENQETRLKEADLIIVNGLDLEKELESLLNSLKGRLFVVSESIEPSTYLSGDNGTTNPFLWMNPGNALKTANALIRKLESKTISFGTSVEQNYQYFKDLILKVDNEIRLERRQYESPTLHFADAGFSYFMNEYKIQQNIIPIEETGPEKLKAIFDKSRAEYLFLSVSDPGLEIFEKLGVKFERLDIFGIEFNIQSLSELYQKNWNIIKIALNS
ncbi:MAG: zinc ABC transporter substrate-binding protein [Spirochaetales bacterium]|nr:zinc ABC transporter substrate-binding protein [Spirochaetales bacterium]